jgi:calcium-dependent protein kinase
MEFIDGVPLFDKIINQEDQLFGEKQASEYMKQLFEAINHCHANGIIHRDIKPENIMLIKNDQIKLIDFGLSKIKSNDQKLQEKVGTPYYMAPEVLESNYNEKADIWSLGVILYVLVSGYLPFQHQDTSKVFKRIK